MLASVAPVGTSPSAASRPAFIAESGIPISRIAHPNASLSVMGSITTVDNRGCQHLSTQSTSGQHGHSTDPDPEYRSILPVHAPSLRFYRKVQMLWNNPHRSRTSTVLVRKPCHLFLQLLPTKNFTSFPKCYERGSEKRQGAKRGSRGPAASCGQKACFQGRGRLGRQPANGRLIA
jgi:hypothetical protein